ncbi:MAG: phosphoglycerate dehydrogenase [Candidatus Eremiobacteraeota bacterium]|nr:phosphoglycerate dehydrogenase [Candidatus Eremiobacteraeota bacterium]
MQLLRFMVVARRVIVAEPFAESGLAVLREAGIEVDSLVGKPRDALIVALEGADGLIVRSETRVDRELLAAGRRLVAVARAGVGVDAIDVDAATQAGIVVLNTPSANTLAATEQTFALMLALIRHTVDAALSLREGRWDRRSFVGTELYGKTLGIVGLGRIGANVAQRAKAFGMKIIAHDPFITQARADAFDATLLTLEELLQRSDIVTLHMALGERTRGLIRRRELDLLRPHAYLINCARGGLIDEEDLLAALDAGKLAGAGIDVVAQEPPPPGGTGARLHRHPKVVSTPHLGGSTVEALERIAVELAQDLARVLLGSPAAGAVNAPTFGGAEGERMRPFVETAYRMGRFYPQYARPASLPTFAFVAEGELSNLSPEPLVTSFLSGLLQGTTDRRVTIVNARTIAEELGVRIEARTETRGSSAYAATLRVHAGPTTIVGTVAGGSPRIVELDGFEIDAIPIGGMVITKHRDVPGMIGKVGTILGDADVNISTMQVSRTQDAGGDAIMVLGVDRRAPDDALERLGAIQGISAVHAIEI